MEYKSYQHIEKIGTTEVENVHLGTCHVFPKIDGTNASIWVDDKGKIQTGSRTRWLAEGQNDNAGFRHAVNEDPQFDGIKEALKNFPILRFYGEWLVPHTLKTYRQDAWRKFYVFDVTQNDDARYLPYEEYKELCDKFNINYIPCIGVVTNGTNEDFIRLANSNNYLIEDGKGIGEGIVIKNYNYSNKFGRKTFAKIVTSEFKEKHYKEMGSPTIDRELIEQEIVNDFCTQTLIDKTHAKIAIDGWTSKMIPRLLETVYHDMVKEEIYEIIKKHKLPRIDFKVLKALTTIKIKELKPDLF